MVISISPSQYVYEQTLHDKVTDATRQIAI